MLGKNLFFYILLAFCLNLSAQSSEKSEDWFINFDQAKKEAAAQNKYILAYFSGSDWCRPCIQLKMEVLESQEFKSFADSFLVVVQFDFPAKQKNKLPDEQVKHNEDMAERFNKEGAFPAVSIIDNKENLLETIKGYNRSGATTYIAGLREIIKASR